MAGQAIARRLTTSTHCAASVLRVFRNFNRAGIEPNKSDISILVPISDAAGWTASGVPCATRKCQPCASPSVREVISTTATETIDGNASPRKPKWAMASKSSSASLEVACRVTAKAISSALIPCPSSATLSPASPPSSSVMSMRLAPASMAFSTSSFKALAGRSTTSPAAIWLISCSGSRRIKGGMKQGAYSTNIGSPRTSSIAGVAPSLRAFC